jgi:hypothetical protein
MGGVSNARSSRWRAVVAAALVLLLLLIVVRYTAREQGVEPTAATAPATNPSAQAAEPATEAHQGFLYGRITTVDGGTYEGRLRWGRDQEAFWGDYFNGAKDENPWAVHAPRTQQPEERRIEIFGFVIGGRDRQNNFGRPFMARLGDIARVDAHVRLVEVTLKSGTTFELDRFEAGDIDDGMRVWDGTRGVVDLDARRIRTIEFLPTAPLAAAPERLHGTVRTRHGDFTGFLQWDRQDCVGLDTLDGRTAGGEVSLRYDSIRSIARHSRDSALVTLLDGRQMVLSGTREVDHRNRGIYVDDRRYGRVLISWDAFERADFSPGGSGPAYGDFPPGRALTGSVTTRAGRRLAGQLVYDFDESETTETLDAAVPGVDYTIPFSLIRSVVPHGREAPGARRPTVILHDGEELQLERSGDLGEGNAGLLVFVDRLERPAFVPWTEVEQVDFDPAPGAQPPNLGPPREAGQDNTAD